MWRSPDDRNWAEFSIGIKDRHLARAKRQNANGWASNSKLHSRIRRVRSVSSTTRSNAKKSSSLVKSTLRLTPRLSTWKTIPNLVAVTFQESCREHPVIHPPPGQQLERFARTQGRAAGGVQVTWIEEKSRAWNTWRKGREKMPYRAGSARNEPVAIVLMPSRRDHFPETPARVGQSCRKLSMSGSSGASLAIRCDKTARVSPTPKGGRGCVFFDTRKPGRPICRLCKACGSTR